MTLRFLYALKETVQIYIFRERNPNTLLQFLYTEKYNGENTVCLQLSTEPNYTIDNTLLNYIAEAADLVAFSPSSKWS